MFTQIIERISRKSPVTVMAQAVLKNVLSDQKLNEIFKNHRQSQRESRWLFSNIVGLMTLVVFQVRRSIGDAYKHYQAVAPAQKSPLYENKIVDGNKIAATQRRLEPLRDQPIAPLAGFALVVYEPEYRLITDVILCEDAYAQERSLFPRLLECLTKTIEVTHPKEPRKVSSYYVAGDVVATYEGMLLVTEPTDWQDFSHWDPKTMAKFLLRLGCHVDYTRYEQNPVPKRKEPRKQVPRGNHVATKRILNIYKKMKILNLTTLPLTSNA